MYGTTGDECYFLLKGKVQRMVPEKTTFAAKTEEDLIRIYAENYENVIWDKIEDGKEMKRIVELYLDDPENLDLDVPKSSRKSRVDQKKFDTLPVDDPINNLVN